MDYVHGWGTYGWGELPWGSSLYERSIEEATSAVDISSSKAAFLVSTIENAAGSDTVSSATAFKVSVSEVVAVNDVVAASTIFKGAVEESSAIGDVISAQFTPTVTVDEGVAILDVILGGADYLAHIEESALAQEELTFGGSTYNIQVHETSNVSDAANANASLGVQVIDSAIAADVNTRRKLWEPIDTGVDEDWTLINTNS